MYKATRTIKHNGKIYEPGDNFPDCPEAAHLQGTGSLEKAEAKKPATKKAEAKG